ncbi:MAG: hypothetical protein IPN47_23160 [Gemmatimonadetes bacterium]|nr:hypothetical protein [Gemmatimonadota bacterium]
MTVTTPLASQWVQMATVSEFRPLGVAADRGLEGRDQQELTWLPEMLRREEDRECDRLKRDAGGDPPA